MIGIALSSIAFKHEVKCFNEADSILNQYKPLAKQYEVDLCMFSFRKIRQNSKMVEALVYLYKQDSLLLKTVPLPRVNIFRNRSYVKDQALIKKFEILRSQNSHFINLPLYWQANKLQNYEHLYSLDQFKSHVPPTKRLSFEDLNSFIRQYGKVIIKPIYGSKGRGITIIEKDRDDYNIFQTSSRKYAYNNRELIPNQKTLAVPDSQLKQFYNETFRNPGSFLIQQWIPFREFNGHPFDIRAVMQKNGNNKWQITSRVARVANEKGQITNLSQGGDMVSLSKLPLKGYHGSIRKFCLNIAETFAILYPWTAEMGIDLAIDKNGKLWYIETNYCPEKTRWSTIYKIPFEYAYYMNTK